MSASPFTPGLASAIRAANAPVDKAIEDECVYAYQEYTRSIRSGDSFAIQVATEKLNYAIRNHELLRLHRQEQKLIASIETLTQRLQYIESLLFSLHESTTQFDQRSNSTLIEQTKS